ncbi:hypothetical protein HGRIS_003435 [Hohenbuehelia grisea]|uniref:G-protein coupled receptors family 1 profile domain-containing protein n=1 Tax=Hohenbuehelia grisea TaxID=104357 RepID=A0ABR3JFM5_9AGAR
MSAGAGAGGSSVGQAGYTLVAAYNAVNTVGLVLLALTFLPAWLTPSVQRSTAWITLMAGAIFYSLGALLIVGNQIGPSPSFGMCLTQATVMYSSPAMDGAAFLALVIELFGAFGSTHLLWLTRRRMLLVYCPYAIVGSVSLFIIILGLTNPAGVRRNDSSFFCHLESPAPLLVSCSILGLCAFMTIPLSAVIAVRLYRNRRSLITNGVQIGMAIRVLVFCALPGPIITLTVLAPNLPPYDGLAFGISTMPIVAALVFGSQKDIVLAWIPWRKTYHAQEEPANTRSSSVSFHDELAKQRLSYILDIA